MNIRTSRRFHESPASLSTFVVPRSLNSKGVYLDPIIVTTEYDYGGGAKYRYETKN